MKHRKGAQGVQASRLRPMGVSPGGKSADCEGNVRPPGNHAEVVVVLSKMGSGLNLKVTKNDRAREPTGFVTFKFRPDPILKGPRHAHQRLRLPDAVGKECRRLACGRWASRPAVSSRDATKWSGSRNSCRGRDASAFRRKFNQSRKQPRGISTNFVINIAVNRLQRYSRSSSTLQSIVCNDTEIVCNVRDVCLQRQRCCLRR